MLTMAVKNTMLMVLIILIFHFLIRNYMFERLQQDATHSTICAPTPKNEEPCEALSPPVSTPISAQNHSDKAPVETQSNKFKENIKSQHESEEELLNFVFAKSDQKHEKQKDDMCMIGVVKASSSPSTATNTVMEYDTANASFEVLKGDSATQSSLDSFFNTSFAA